MGNVSKFNAEGKFIVRKDLPKERRYINTIEWTWEQWCGRNETKTITENCDIYKKCYPREFIPPPSEEITWTRLDKEILIVGREFLIKNVDRNSLKHSINLFLELFGECEIRRADLSSIRPFKVVKLNWHLLPPGEYPWQKLREHTEILVAEKHSRYSNVILSRQDHITKYEPDEVYVGNGGFSIIHCLCIQQKGNSNLGKRSN